MKKIVFSVILIISILITYIVPCFAVSEVILGGLGFVTFMVIALMTGRGLLFESEGMTSDQVFDKVSAFSSEWLEDNSIDPDSIIGQASRKWVTTSSSNYSVISSIIDSFIDSIGLSSDTVGSSADVYRSVGSFVTDTNGKKYAVYSADGISGSSTKTLIFNQAFSILDPPFAYNTVDDASLQLPFTKSIVLLTGDYTNTVSCEFDYGMYNTRREITLFINGTRKFSSETNASQPQYLCGWFSSYDGIVYVMLNVSSGTGASYVGKSGFGYPVNAELLSDNSLLNVSVDSPYSFPSAVDGQNIYVDAGIGTITSDSDLPKVADKIVAGDLTTIVEVSTDVPAVSEADIIASDVASVVDMLPFVPNQLEILEIPNALYNAVSDTGTNCDLVLKAGNVSIAGHSYHFWDQQTIPLTNTINQDIFLPILWAVRFLFGIALFKTIIYWVNRIVGVCMMEDSAIQSIEGRKERSNDS